MEQIEQSSKSSNTKSLSSRFTKNPLMRTKQYFSLKLPKRNNPQVRAKIDGKNFSVDDSQILKDSGSSSGSVGDQPSSANQKETKGTADVMTSELSQSFSSSLIPSTLTVETTQTSKLVVRNVPSSAFNISRATMTSSPKQEPKEKTVPPPSSSNGHTNTVFEFDTNIRNTNLKQNNGLPCSPTVLEQNNRNSSAEMLHNVLPNDCVYPRSQSALGCRNTVSMYDPSPQYAFGAESKQFAGSTDIASEMQQSRQFNNALHPNMTSKSRSTDGLQSNGPSPLPRIDKMKHTYQNIPSAAKFWDNASSTPNLMPLTACKSRAKSPLPSIAEPRIVVSDIPLDPLNLSLLEVLLN